MRARGSRPGTYEGARDTVARGGVVVRASDVTVKRVRVEGGERRAAATRRGSTSRSGSSSP